MDSEWLKTPKTKCLLKVYEGKESISLDSRFADHKNPKVEYNLKLIVYFNYNHDYSYKNLVFFPYVYGGGHG